MAIPGRNETRTLSPKGGALNLSRGFFQVDKNWVRVTMGRQRFSLGTQRFVGEYDWDHQGRAFDGIRYEFPQTGVGELSFGLFGVGDSLQFLSKDNHTFTFLDFSSISWQAHSLGLYGAYYQSGKNAQDFTYFYGGTRIGGHIKRVFYQLETIFQIGEKQSADKSALAGGLEFGLIWSDSNFFALGTDFMSGSGSGRSKRQYNSPFYSAHRFFGDLDLFENNPIGGVIDLFGEFFVQIHRTIRAKVAGHIFRLYARDKLYGYEGTFNIEGRFFPKSALTIGFDTFIPGAGAKLLMSTGQAADEAIWRMYIMPNFWF